MDATEIIIENVKLHECLYNLGSKGYKNVQKKTEIWDKIGGLVNLSGDACRKRWKGLRDTYKRRKRTAQLASGSGAPSPSKKWKYTESLQFLDDYKDARATIGSVEGSEIDFEYLFDCSSSTVLNENITTDESTTDTNEVRPRNYTKKNSDAEVTSVFKEVMKECADSVKELASANSNERGRDSTSLLLESLAKKISEANLPQSVVSRIEAKVVNLVYDEISQNLTP